MQCPLKQYIKELRDILNCKKRKKKNSQGPLVSHFKKLTIYKDNYYKNNDNEKTSNSSFLL